MRVFFKIVIQDAGLYVYYIVIRSLRAQVAAYKKVSILIESSAEWLLTLYTSKPRALKACLTSLIHTTLSLIPPVLQHLLISSKTYVGSRYAVVAIST